MTENLNKKGNKNLTTDLQGSIIIINKKKINKAKPVKPSQIEGK